MILIFNKPYGVISQFTEKVSGQQTLAGFGFPKNVYPIGRLDLDSEGLLLLSDEGEWTDWLLNPQNEHERVYHAQVEGLVTEGACAKLRGGVVIQGWKTQPCYAAPLTSGVGYALRHPPIRVRQSIPTSWMELRLIEGKNRQVRRMTASVGLPTLRLIRAAIGSLRLGVLPVGEWRALTAEERKRLLT